MNSRVLWLASGYSGEDPNKVSSFNREPQACAQWHLVWILIRVYLDVDSFTTDPSRLVSEICHSNGLANFARSVPNRLNQDRLAHSSIVTMRDADLYCC